MYYRPICLINYLFFCQSSEFTSNLQTQRCAFENLDESKKKQAGKMKMIIDLSYILYCVPLLRFFPLFLFHWMNKNSNLKYICDAAGLYFIKRKVTCNRNVFAKKGWIGFIKLKVVKKTN